MSLFFSCVIITNRQTEKVILRSNVFLRIIIVLTFGLWLVLFLPGKSGFVHILLLVSAGVAIVEALRVYRSRLTEDLRRTD